MTLVKNRDGIHLEAETGDYSLCGDAMDGEEPDFDAMKNVKATHVTCKKCLKIIAHVSSYLKEQTLIRKKTRNK